MTNSLTHIDLCCLQADAAHAALQQMRHELEEARAAVAVASGQVAEHDGQLLRLNKQQAAAVEAAAAEARREAEERLEGAAADAEAREQHLQGQVREMSTGHSTAQLYGDT